MNHKRSVVVKLLLLASLVGCAGGAPSTQAALPTTTLHIGNIAYTLEIADTYDTREFGLMKRDSMPDDHGMIFVFTEAEKQNFWMKNTRIPLDILFVGASGKIVSIHTMKPYDLTATPSDGLAKWAIELNAGQAQKSAVKVGDVLTIPPDARDAKE